jgi:hypothetical protein
LRQTQQGVSVRENNTFARFLRGEMPSYYFPLPNLEPLWNAAYALELPEVPPWPGEPDDSPSALEHLSVLIGWLRSKQHPAPATAAPASTPTEEGGALASYLSSHPDATEDETLDAVNAALLAGIKAWSLDKLRKYPLWKAHVNQRIGTFMDANPDATVKQIADAVGYSPSTVHGSDAYRQRRPAREERKALQKAEKERQRKQKKRDTFWRIALARVRELAKDYWGKRDADSLRSYLLQCQSEQKWVQAEWPEYVGSLSNSDMTRLLASPPQDETVLSPEEEDARVKARARNYQRRRDNR